MEKHGVEKQDSELGFRVMSAWFRIRDIIRPRKNILIDAGIRPGSSVLDFGCGPGGYILPLAQMLGATGRIYALDINPAAVKAVKKLADRHKLANVETILSGKATGLPDGCIDFVLLYDVFHHLNNSHEVLGEIHRVLKKEGILSMNDHHLSEDEITTSITASGRFRLLRKGEKVYNFSKV